MCIKSGQKMKIHLYQRSIIKNGKTLKAWYYWYYDRNGKQVRKSCGVDGKPCLVKREAQAFIENIVIDDLSESTTYEKFCKGFYDSGSKFLLKQKSRGIEYQPNSIYQKQLYLKKFLEKFGSMDPNKVSELDIENWLLELELSNSVKNHILSIINEVESELYAYHFVKQIKHIKRFKRFTKSKGILTIPEIQKLFPADYDELLNIWKVLPTEREIDTYTFATMIYTILSTGMRSGEIRALQWNQFIRPDAILINAMINFNEERVDHLKKGDSENKKWRVTVLPDKTVSMLSRLKAMQDNDNEYVFNYKGEAVTTWRLLEHFKSVLKKNNIDAEKRNITVHSLRFTYNTLMKQEISGDDLRLMMGHTSEEMTEYYDKSKALDHLPTLLMNKNNINSIFS